MRGEVYWVDLDTPTGSEPGYRRPAVVVQDDAANRAGSTTIVAMISSKVPDTRYPMHVLLPPDLLPKPSVVKCEQLITIDIERRIVDEFSGPIATLGAATMIELDSALSRILGL